MEPESSRGDSPENNPAPAQTEGLSQERVLGSYSYLMEMEADFERISKKKVEMCTFLGSMAEKASSALDSLVNWEEIDAHYTSMGDSLKKREMEVELKEKSVLEQILELEKKEERLRNVEEREKKIELLEKSISLILKEKEEELEIKQILESSLLILVLEKNGEEVIDVLEEKRLEEVKSRELEKEKEAELVENSLKQLEVREKELLLLDETIKEKLTALETREEIFEAKQKEKAEEMKLKRMLLEEREKEIELKQMELEERSKQAKTSKRSRVESTNMHPAKRHKRLVREPVHDGEGKETDSTCVASSIETGEANEGETEVLISKDSVDEDLESLICADSEFYDFKKTINSFVVDKIWALYDPLDHMPRLYGRIMKIIKSRLSLRVKWLEPKEEESVPVACGRFMYGKTETVSHLVFSHEAHPIMSRFIISLNPRKGETWALFRDWNKSWKNNPNQHNPPYRYDFVEILFDFNEQHGIGVSYLGKVEGFRSVFKHAGKDGVVSVMISPEEMHRFSHRVPSFRLNGEEKEGVPAGSFELDPAAVPESTLNVKEAKESEREIEDCGKASEVEDQNGSRREIPMNLD